MNQKVAFEEDQKYKVGVHSGFWMCFFFGGGMISVIQVVEQKTS